MSAATLVRFLAQAAIWGSSFTLIKIAVRDVSPDQLVLSRLALGAAVLAIVALLSRMSLRMSGLAWMHVTVSAVFATVVPYLLLSFGEQHTGAGLAGVLIGGTPLLTLLFATLALRSERATRRGVVGFVLGFVGVVLVVAPWASGGGSLAGSLACFAAAASYAVGYVYVRRFLTPFGIAPLTLATTQLVAAVVLQLLITPFFGWQPIRAISVGAVVSIVLLGVLSTGLANILYFRLIQDIGAAGAAAVDYVVPIFAVLFGVILLGEPITWNVIAGGVIVLLGMGVAEGRLRRRPRSVRSALSPECEAPGSG